jgi:hypothetical protein
MPGIMHEGPIELLRCNPLLAAALLGGLGVPVAAGGTAVMALTGAIDLEKEESRRLVLATIAAAGLSDDRLGTYTHLIRAAAPASALEALEALMSTVFKDEFIERYIAEGRAKGEAEGRAKGEAEVQAAMLLRMLAALGFDVPDGIRERVLECPDPDQLGAWPTPPRPPAGRGLPSLTGAAMILSGS